MDEDADRSSILKRRAAFIAAALASMTAAASCGGKVVFVDGDGSGAEAQGGAGGAGGEGAGIPQPCLGAPLGGEGGMPQPCLEAPIGGSNDGGAKPCLAPQ
jgi:hypothetical protein